MNAAVDVVAATAEDSSAVGIPTGMREVGRDEFFGALRADARDVMPFPEFYADHDCGMYSEWQVVRTRELWGWSSDERYARLGDVA